MNAIKFMPDDAKINLGDVLYIIFLSLILTGALFLFQGNTDFDLTDEGLLWYGASSTAQGDVPIRDFRSYDPGRYYWTAGWSFLFGDGIMALRLSLSLFQMIGLIFGLLAVRRLIANRLILIPAGIMLIAWMFTRHKTFEPAIAMAGIYFALRLLENPSSRQHFIAGIFVGLAAFFGRNHGMYNLLAFLSLIILMRYKIGDYPLLRRSGIWLIGIIVGCLPYLLMFAFIPGFLSAFAQSIVSIITQHSTIVPKSIPWPWTIDYSNMGILSFIKSLLRGIFYLIIPLFYILAIIYAIFSRASYTPSKLLLIASGFVGIFYLHHTMVRSDLGHLAQSIHPFLIGMLAMPYAFGFSRKWVTTGFITFLFLLTVLVAVPNNPGVQKITSTWHNRIFVKHHVGGDELWIRAKHAKYIDDVTRIVNNYVKPEDGLLIVPRTPGFYPILGRKSPVWNTYMLWPEEEGRQVEMIENLERNNVNWALIADSALDSRDELRFRNTHSLVWAYLLHNFEVVEERYLPRNHYLLHRK